MAVTSEEVSSVFATPPGARYDYFCERVVAADAIWYLRVNDAPLYVRQGRDQLLALWSAPEFAYVAMRAQWPQAVATRLDLDSWLFAKLPRLRSCGFDVAVMLDSSGQGRRATAGELAGALEVESRRLLARLVGSRGDPLDAWHKQQRAMVQAGPRGRQS